MEATSSSVQTTQAKGSGFGVAASARDVSPALASAPDLNTEFNKKSKVVVLAPASTFDPEMGADKTTKVNVAALSQKQIPAMGGDSFSASMA